MNTSSNTRHRARLTQAKSLWLVILLIVGAIRPAIAAGLTQSKEAEDATWHAPMRPDLQGVPGVGDLALDPGFAGGFGFRRIDFNDANGKRDEGLRIFPIACGLFCTQYFVLGKHAHGNGWDALITKISQDGSIDTSFGNNGRLVVATPQSFINDAAMDSTGTRFYFAGNQYTGVVADHDFAVTCITSAGTVCAGFGSNGTVTKGFDLGSNRWDNAQRIVYRPVSGSAPASLIVGGAALGGTVAAPSSRVGVLALDPATGSVRQGFGSGGMVTLQIGNVADTASVGVFDMALSKPGMPGGERVYVAGTYKRNASGTDHDGYLLALDPDTGVFASTFANVPIAIHNDIGPPDNLYDAVTAIRVQPDGKVVMAGMSIDATSHYQLLLARMKPMGGFDASFCGGGVCAHPSFFATDVVPRAIAVRPMTRDLVVAMESVRNPPGESARTVQHIEQYSASGNTLHGSNMVEFPTKVGQTPNATMRDLLIGSTILAGYAMTVGITRWSDSDNDYDVTVTRMTASDEIFANTFGAADSD